MASNLKQKAHDFCQRHIDSKLENLHRELEKIKESLLSETKSTAGDKHETGRAMIQLQRESLGKQLFDVEKMQQFFKKVPMETKSDKVVLGSFVRTGKVNFYLALPVGKIETESIPTYGISITSPIGQLLLGKEVGDHFIFNNEKLTIKEIA